MRRVLDQAGIAASVKYPRRSMVEPYVAFIQETLARYPTLRASRLSGEYVLENLDVIKGRYMNLNKDAAGATVDEYGRRVKLVFETFLEWKADRSGWEKRSAAKQTARPAGDGDKRPKAKADKPKPQPQAQSPSNGAAHQAPPNPETRTVTFPIRPDFDLSVTLPRAGISVDELKRLVYFLLPYAQDWEPSQSPRSVFPMLEREEQ